MIRAVLFDLDDTLFPQSAWLDGAWDRVCATAGGYGVDPGELRRSLETVVAARSSGGGGIIDEALARTGAWATPVAPLVTSFRAHRPQYLPTYPGVPAFLEHLRSRFLLALVTDGDESIQRAKVAALGLEDHFDTVVYSDRLGRERRKPHPAPFHAAVAALDVGAADSVFVGDHPVKDVAGPHAVGMRAIRVLTGEHARRPGPEPWATVGRVTEAAAVLEASASATGRRS